MAETSEPMRSPNCSSAALVCSASSAIRLRVSMPSRIDLAGEVGGGFGGAVDLLLGVAPEVLCSSRSLRRSSAMPAVRDSMRSKRSSVVMLVSSLREWSRVV